MSPVCFLYASRFFSSLLLFSIESKVQLKILWISSNKMDLLLLLLLLVFVSFYFMEILVIVMKRPRALVNELSNHRWVNSKLGIKRRWKKSSCCKMAWSSLNLNHLIEAKKRTKSFNGRLLNSCNSWKKARGEEGKTALRFWSFIVKGITMFKSNLNEEKSSRRIEWHRFSNVAAGCARSARSLFIFSSHSDTIRVLGFSLLSL